MIAKNFTDEFDRDVTINIYYADNGTDAVYASITRDSGRLGEFLLTNGRVYACSDWDDLQQRYRQLVLVNPYDPVVGILIGSQEALLYLERFAEILGKIRGEVTVGRRRSR